MSAKHLRCPYALIRMLALCLLPLWQTCSVMMAYADDPLPQRSRDAWTKWSVQIGKSGEASPEDIALLRRVVSSSELPMAVRGYASWALDQLEPWPADAPPRTFHVAQQHPDADDANPGSEDRPWQTIQKAAETLQPGDTVVIHAGTYREMVQPFRGGTSLDRMITYHAAPGEQPVIQGSDIWKTSWSDEGKGLWSTAYDRHPWDKPEKWKTPFEGAMFRCEQIYVDGQFYTHVDTLDELREQANRFYTQDDGAHGRLWTHLSDDKTPDAVVIERSMRQHCFYPVVRGLGYVRVTGLHMRHTAAPEFSKDWGAIGMRPVMSVRAGHGWIIEDNTIEWGNAQGLDIGAWSWGQDGENDPYVTDTFGHHQVRRNRVDHNGISGIAGLDAVRYLVVEDNQTKYNGHKGHFHHYEKAGIKLHTPKNTIIRRNVSMHNDGFGIWLDWDARDSRITENIVVGNMGGGIFIEATDGPVLVDTNVIRDTRLAPTPSWPDNPWADGVYGHDANSTIVTNNYIADSASMGVRLRVLFGRDGPGDQKTTARHNRVFNNILARNQGGGICFNPDTKLSGDNQSDNNLYFQRSDQPLVMVLEHAGSDVKWRETPIGRKLNLQGDVNAVIPLNLWQTILGQDRQSKVLAAADPLASLAPPQVLAVLTQLRPSPPEDPLADPRTWWKPRDAGALWKELKDLPSP